MKTYQIKIYKAKKAIGFGFWFGYKFNHTGYTTIYKDGMEFPVTTLSRVFSFYLPFYVFAISLNTTIYNNKR
jgi:hypothetical protein